MFKTVTSLFTKPLSTVAEEMTSKFKTPFFTTFITVWIFKNNLFIYNLFFNQYIPDKTFILKDQFTFDRSFFINTAYTILISLGVLIVFYFILNISRSITMYSEERVKLNLLKNLKSSSITTIEDVQYWKNQETLVREKNTKLQEEINILRLNTTHLESNIETTEKKLNKLKVQGEATINQIINVVDQNLVNNISGESDFNKRAVNTKKGIEQAIKPYTNLNKVPTLLSI